MVEFVVMGLAAVFATIIVLAGSARPARGDGGPELPIPAAPTGTSSSSAWSASTALLSASGAKVHKRLPAPGLLLARGGSPWPAPRSTPSGRTPG